MGVAVETKKNGLPKPLGLIFDNGSCPSQSLPLDPIFHAKLQLQAAGAAAALAAGLASGVRQQRRAPEPTGDSPQAILKFTTCFLDLPQASGAAAARAAGVLGSLR